MSRIIEIPDAIRPIDLQGRPLSGNDGKIVDAITFETYVKERAFDLEMIKNYEGLQRAYEISRSIEKSAKHWELPESHWKHLIASIENPTGGYLPWAWNLIPFARAILDAKPSP